MIKTTNGRTQIEGTRYVILSELSSIVDTLKQDFTEDDIRLAVNLGLKSEEEIDKALKDISGFISDLKKGI